MAKWNSVALEEAASNIFEQAVNLDPGFALAYVGLADAYVAATSAFFGYTEQNEMSLAKAEVLIRKGPGVG